MADPRTFVVVGAGLCGATAVATLRSEGFDGRIVLIGAEELPPVRAPTSVEGIPARRGLPSSRSWCGRPSGIASRTSRRDGARTSRSSTRDAREVVLAGGERVAFDAFLMATGGHNRKIEAPGSELPGVLDLRYVGDADRLRAAVARWGARRVRGHGVHRGGGRRLAPNDGVRRHRHRDLRDRAVPGPRRRHRARARGDPSRPRRDDALQRSRRALRGRRQARAGRDEGRPDRRGGRRGRRDRDRAGRAPDGGNGPRPAGRGAGRARRWRRRSPGCSPPATSRATTTRCSVRSGWSTSTTR